MLIALAQLNSTDDIEKNYEQIAGLIAEAGRKDKSERPRIIFFPENSLYFRIDSNDEVPRLDFASAVIKNLEALSLKFDIYLHLTTSFFHEEKTWNASILMSPGAKSQVVYNKIHLFDIQLQGDKAIRESDVFSHGHQPAIFEVDDFRFGSSICYDLRFSELYHNYALAQVDAILVPAAFLVKTGIAHWEVLLRARAIESQAFVLAPAQQGTHRSLRTSQLRETYGHSLIVDPWGLIVAQKESGVGLLVAEIDRKRNFEVRAQIPMHAHRRLLK